MNREAESMRQMVAQFLYGIERYNPENLATLERYVQVQSQENAYDLEANIAVLKFYQFNQRYNIEVTSQILLKALTNLPHTDFALCKCLLNEQTCKESPIDQICYLADLLESSDFPTFWNRVYSVPDLYIKISGFQDSIRKFVCHVVGITFQTINKYLLSELLGNIDDSALKVWVKKYGWKEIENNLIFVSNQDENIKTKNITEEISFDKLVDVILLFGVLNALIFNPKSAAKNYKKFKGLFDKFEEVYFNYVYRRVSDCSHSPISSIPGSKVFLIDRKTEDYGWTFKLSQREKECINLGSFNYLGFSETVENEVQEIWASIDKYGVEINPSFAVTGQTSLHLELEKLTAEFLGIEDAVVYSTGFSTNALNLPVILSKDCLVLSDQKNHASMILGIRLAGSKVVKYAHRNLEDLEKKLIENIKANQENNYQLFSKILIATESIYSMDGTIINLEKMIALKKKYKAYLFIDDAHGVGVIGSNCRGIIGKFNILPSDIDILMGTYSKAFASNGGFIAGSKDLINHIRKHSYSLYGSLMPAATVQKAILSINKLMSYDVPKGNIIGDRLRALTKYFRKRLKSMGLNIVGDEDSQIVPWVLGSISAVAFVIRELKKRNVAAAGVIYPATSLTAARIRFNVSASHTEEDIDKVVPVKSILRMKVDLNGILRNSDREFKAESIDINSSAIAIVLAP
ncbi:hypothetical protein V9T40_012076 [Parthenolecanium corni]|uniref:Eukaryotic translation initiation factor 3 subunit K n=1 Tax=Parthenolecanium corni TaxID=536013 RepID=A0AAN9Y040_9HEMI